MVSGATETGDGVLHTWWYRTLIYFMVLCVMMESDQGELPVFGTMIVYVCGSISVNMEEE